MKEKELGNVVSIDIDMTVPEKMKFEGIDFKTLVLLLGKNGVGKTFVMKLVWLLSTQANNMVMATSEKIDYPAEEGFKFLIDHTFTDNNLTGVITMSFKYGNYIKVELENGECTKLVGSFEDDTVCSSTPVFMSKETRLLDDFVKYIKFKKMLGINKGFPTNPDEVSKLVDIYMIYDIIFMEKQLLKFEKISSAQITEFNSRIKEFDNKVTLTDLRVDYDIPDIFYTLDGDTEKTVRSLGAGHQALFNIILST